MSAKAEGTTRGSFPTTHWTLIARLRSPDRELVRRALDELCSQYHYPLYCYIRRRGLAHHDAQDALHDFLSKLLRLDAFASATEEKGKLRGYLAAGLQRFLTNWHRDRDVRPEGHSDSLNTDDDEARYQRERLTERDTPERLFERKWGQELLLRVLRSLEAEYMAKGKGLLFRTLKPILRAGGSLRGENTPQLAHEVGLTEGALRVAHSRLLRDFRQVLEAEVFMTVSSRSEVEDEIAYLMQVFQKG